MKLYQITVSLSYGDGVTNCIFYLSQLLSENGIENYIATNNLDSRLENEGIIRFESISELDINDDDIVIYSFAIGNKLNIEVEQLKCKKILLYQNVTPPEYFRNIDEDAEKSCLLGRFDVKYTAGNYLKCITPSMYSKKELISQGWNENDIVVIPLIDESKTAKDFSKAVEKKYLDGKKNIIFVGRIVRNKKHEDVLRIFEYYISKYREDVRLIFVGSGDNQKYGEALKNYCRINQIENVVFTGHVTNKELVTYYKIADLFLCMSEHEGLCIPILEAMNYGVPVIAYNAAAVPDTMGAAGILVDTKDEHEISEIIDRIFNDKEYNNNIIKSQKERIKKYNIRVYKNELLQCITDVRDIKDYRYRFSDDFLNKYTKCYYNNIIYNGLVVDFKKEENCKSFLRKGFGEVEDIGVWTISENAEILLRIDEKGSYKVTLIGRFFSKYQRMTICLNEKAEQCIYATDAEYVFYIDEDDIKSKYINVKLHLNDAIRPIDIDESSSDIRTLSFLLSASRFEKVSNAKKISVDDKSDKVAVIIVNYNDKPYIFDCINSIKEQTVCNKVEILVVDNGSTDGSVEILEAYYPEIVLFKLEHNTGFGFANNVAIDYALKRGYSHILLLNPDTIIEKNMINLLLKKSNKNVVAPSMYSDKDFKNLWYAGGRIDYERALCNQLLYGDVVKMKSSYRVGFITGCCMLISSDVLRKVGLFDEKYYLYYEDVDLCARLDSLGIEQLYIPKAKLWHRVGGSTGGGENSYIAKYYSYRNRMYFWEKYYKKAKRNFVDCLRDWCAFLNGIEHYTLEYFIAEAAKKDYENRNLGEGVYSNNIIIRKIWPLKGVGEEYWIKETNFFDAYEIESEFAICNVKREKKKYVVSFEINSLTGSSCEISINNNKVKQIQKNELIYLCINLEAESFSKLTIKMLGIDSNYNKKRLYKIKNIRVREFNDNLLMGFYTKELCENDFWYWAGKKDNYYYLKANKGLNEFSCLIEGWSKENNIDIDLKVDNKFLAHITQEGHLSFKIISYTDYDIHELYWHVNSKIVNGIGGDSRRFAFRLINPRVNYIRIKDIEFDEGFYFEERDAISKWIWAGAKKNDMFVDTTKGLNKFVFKIKAAPDTKDLKLRAIVDEKKEYSYEKEGQYCIEFSELFGNIHHISWYVDSEIKNGIEGDSRNFAFMLSDYQLQRVNGSDR